VIAGDATGYLVAERNCDGLHTLAKYPLPE